MKSKNHPKVSETKFKEHELKVSQKKKNPFGKAKKKDCGKRG